MTDEQRGYRKERPLAEIIPPDRRRLYATALVIGGMIAGAALLAFVQQATKPKPAPPVAPLQRETDIETFAVGVPTADITSPRGGPLAPDGETDQSFDLVVDGAVEAITIASVDSAGHEFGTTLWGTAGGGRPHWQLAVFEDGRSVTGADGTLTPLREGKHRLRLYASDNGTFEPGSYFRAYVVRPGGQITMSAPLAFTGHGPAHARASSFDRSAAAGALGAVNVKACDSEQGVNGPGHVTVVFANDGSISDVEVDQGLNMNTPRGSCIARAFKTARVPPFTGAPVRVGKSFRSGLALRGTE